MKKIRPINQFIPSIGVEMAFVKGVLSTIDAYTGDDPENVISAGYKAIREFYGIGNVITVSTMCDKPIIVEFPLAADGTARSIKKDTMGSYVELDDENDVTNEISTQDVLDAYTVLSIMLGSLLD